MPQFAVCHITKNGGNVYALGAHIDRSNTPINADPSRSHLNEIIVDHGKNLNHAIQSRIEAGYTGSTAIRKDAVKSINLVLTGSHNRMKEIEEEGKLQSWVQDNQKYLNEKYGEKNVVSMALHMDERTPHIHAVVVPLTVDGRLSAKQIVGNKHDLKQQQTEYAQRMEKYGLNRGVENSRARHEDVTAYYTRLNQPVESTIEIPKKELFESKSKYQERVKEAIKPLAMTAVQRNDFLKKMEEDKERLEREKQRNQREHENIKRMLQKPLEVWKRKEQEAREKGAKSKQDLRHVVSRVVHAQTPDELAQIQEALRNRWEEVEKEKAIKRQQEKGKSQDKGGYSM